MYSFLDKFLILFHCIFALFTIFGWIWKKTRKLNLIFLLLTAFSWFILGIWYGIGYCPLTHYHWRIRWELGYQDMPGSYIKFLLDTLTGFDFNPALVDSITALIFSIALVTSLLLNIKDWKDRRANSF